MRIAAIFLVASVCCASSFTLDQVLSAPIPTDLVASRGGAKLAWVLSERGVRNIWIASAPGYKGIRATAYAQDDGQEIGEIEWLPDSSALVYTRGGDLQFPGLPDPNPATITAGVEQDIWLLHPGQPPRKIGAGHSPAISPAGDRIAFIRAGQLFIASVDGNREPEQLVHLRPGVKAASLRWSPDGARLAFVSTRNDHSFIAVYTFSSRTIAYLDPSVDRDDNPVWSPDSTQLAFTRNFAGGVSGRGLTSPQPWAIRIANAATGAGRQLWRADSGMGSVFHPVVADRQLAWTASGRILFPWEKDGWLHLYTVSADGGPARLLTPGEFEIDQLSVNDDSSEAIVSSNQRDIDRRHIWRVPLDSGPPQAVTTGESLEWSPVFAGRAVAYFHADGRRPARAAIQTGQTVTDLAPESIPADFPASSLIVPQPIIYSASDGLRIHAQLFLPPNSQPGQKHPAVLFLHGGPRRQMLLGWHSMDYYNHAYAMNQYLAAQGYVVFVINYRSGIGYGAAFREYPNQGSGGASEFADVEGAGLYLRTRSDVDPDRIGVWGGSYGGYLTAMALSRSSDLFAAGVDYHGVHDWSVRIAAGGRPWEHIVVPTPPTPAARAAREEAILTAYNSSPISSVRSWRSPVLFIHGDDDRNVDFSQTVNLIAALRRQNVYLEQLIIPDEVHEFLRHTTWLKVYNAQLDFFHRKL